MTHESDPTLLFLVGPTAAGKSAISLAIAERLGAEIISLDSMQVYRGMDIGTAKATRLEREQVRHHMLDLVEPNERYDVQRWLGDVEPVLADLRARGKRALFVGGTGFYLRSLLSGIFAGPAVDRSLRARIEARAHDQGNAELHRELATIDPPAALRIHPNDTKRLVRALEVWEQTGRRLSEWQREWSWYGAPSAANASGIARERPHRIVGLDVPVSELDHRIAVRARAMLAAGWPLEAAAIRARKGFSPTSIQALGYREALELADGGLDEDACADRIALRTRQFARRQRTWYRRFSAIRWLRTGDANAEESFASLIEDTVRALDR